MAGAGKVILAGAASRTDLFPERFARGEPHAARRNVASNDGPSLRLRSPRLSSGGRGGQQATCSARYAGQAGRSASPFGLGDARTKAGPRCETLQEGPRRGVVIGDGFFRDGDLDISRPDRRTSFRSVRPTGACQLNAKRPGAGPSSANQLTVSRFAEIKRRGNDWRAVLPKIS